MSETTSRASQGSGGYSCLQGQEGAAGSSSSPAGVRASCKSRGTREGEAGKTRRLLVSTASWVTFLFAFLPPLRPNGGSARTIREGEKRWITMAFRKHLRRYFLHPPPFFLSLSPSCLRQSRSPEPRALLARCASSLAFLRRSPTQPASLHCVEGEILRSRKRSRDSVAHSRMQERLSLCDTEQWLVGKRGREKRGER